MVVKLKETSLNTLIFMPSRAPASVSFLFESTLVIVIFIFVIWVLIIQ